VIQRPLAEHFEILSLVPRRFLGVLLVEGVGQARAFDRCLFDTVHRFGRGDAADLEDGRDDVNDVAKLLA
jgi:hypothetical protein